jgi:hypothetical protein
VTISTPGKIERTTPSPGLRDLTDKNVRDQIVSEARKDANSSLARNRRAAMRTQTATGQTIATAPGGTSCCL